MALQEGTVYFKDINIERIDCKISPVDRLTAELSWTGTGVSETYDGYYHAYCEFLDDETVTVYRRKNSSQMFVHWEVINA